MGRSVGREVHGRFSPHRDRGDISSRGDGGESCDKDRGGDRKLPLDGWTSMDRVARWNNDAIVLFDFISPSSSSSKQKEKEEEKEDASNHHYRDADRLLRRALSVAMELAAREREGENVSLPLPRPKGPIDSDSDSDEDMYSFSASVNNPEDSELGSASSADGGGDGDGHRQCGECGGGGEDYDEGMNAFPSPVSISPTADANASETLAAVLFNAGLLRKRVKKDNEAATYFSRSLLAFE